MKKSIIKNLILVISIISMVLISMFTSTVFAESKKDSKNEKVVLELENKVNSLNNGDEISIKVKLTKNQDSDYDINSFSGILEYDKDILDIVGTEDNGVVKIESIDNWDVDMNINTGKIIAYCFGETNNKEIATIKVKVKSSEKAKNTTVTLKNLEVTNLVDATSNQDDVKVIVGKKSILDNKNILTISAGVIVVLILVLLIVVMKKKNK